MKSENSSVVDCSLIQSCLKESVFSVKKCAHPIHSDIVFPLFAQKENIRSIQTKHVIYDDVSEGMYERYNCTKKDERNFRLRKEA